MLQPQTDRICLVSTVGKRVEMCPKSSLIISRGVLAQRRAFLGGGIKNNGSCDAGFSSKKPETVVMRCVCPVPCGELLLHAAIVQEHLIGLVECPVILLDAPPDESAANGVAQACHPTLVGLLLTLIEDAHSFGNSPVDEGTRDVSCPDGRLWNTDFAGAHARVPPPIIRTLSLVPCFSTSRRAGAAASRR